MLISDDFVFLHMPKTGGGSVRLMLTSIFPPGYIRRGPHPWLHPGWRVIPPEAASLPVFCHVRNPWDWYVSWYEFSRRNGPAKRNINAKLWHSAFGDDPDFATFLHRACSGGLVHDRPEIGDRLRAGEDFYTVRWDDLVGGIGDDRLTVGPYEDLVGSLKAFLVDVAAPVPDDFVEQAGSAEVVHAVERPHYREYYDDELRELVAIRCSYFVERFGYSF